MYTIFINDAVIYLTDDAKDTKEKSFMRYDSNRLSDILRNIEKGFLTDVHLYHPDLEFLWYDFKRHFELIEAAGGIVFNESDEVLWIYRNGRWDLPKGKIEKNEDKETAAIREVEEECGITKVILNDFLMSTYHIYQYKEETVLKVTHWYKMFADRHQELTPQMKEGITKVVWIGSDSMNEALNDTYGNIRMLFSRVQK